MELNVIYNEDCLEGMKRIPDGSIDMILCDLPYGTTKCKWDTIIPFEPLWREYERIVKENAAIALTAIQPYASQLILSNYKYFRYEWIWHKDSHANFLFANKMPLKKHENILIFYKRQPLYNPQMTQGKANHGHKLPYDLAQFRSGLDATVKRKDIKKDGLKFPSTIQFFPTIGKGKNIHPTQKPISLFEYLIKTYTNEGETILDNCMGSGTTAIACINTGRNYIGFEKDETYYQKSIERIEKHTHKLFV